MWTTNTFSLPKSYIFWHISLSTVCCYIKTSPFEGKKPTPQVVAYRRLATLPGSHMTPACLRSWTRVNFEGMSTLKTGMTKVAGNFCSHIGTVSQAVPAAKSHVHRRHMRTRLKCLPCCTASSGKPLIKKKPISSSLCLSLFWLFHIIIELYMEEFGCWVLLRSKSKITLRAETTVHSPQTAVSNLCSQVTVRDIALRK